MAHCGAERVVQVTYMTLLSNTVYHRATVKSMNGYQKQMFFSFFFKDCHAYIGLILAGTTMFYEVIFSSLFFFF